LITGKGERAVVGVAKEEEEEEEEEETVEAEGEIGGEDEDEDDDDDKEEERDDSRETPATAVGSKARLVILLRERSFAVLFFLLVIVTSDPRAMRRLTASGCPEREAVWRGVLPFESLQLMSTFSRTSSWITRVDPPAAALCNGVSPAFPSLASLSALSIIPTKREIKHEIKREIKREIRKMDSAKESERREEEGQTREREGSRHTLRCPCERQSEAVFVGVLCGRL